MYIKSMVLEGFKSYAQRTEIYGFDPEFNAITGLNGSGKSNILDGICFLLGITTLSHVRALNLNELVYKNGQAGVTKATVSITFDNSNKEQSPLGYADFNEITVTRQISIGNRNKYMINGHQANNQRVYELFRSVHLNVNNPHFLIMQGRITKVLNMKPEEILSMVEEATGTRLYENKKELTSRLLAKKDEKLSEIDKKILEELNPSLLKLKEDREAYHKFQEINRELEHLNKFHIALTYYGHGQMLDDMKGKLNELTNSVSSTKREIEAGEREVEAGKKALTALERDKDKEAGGKLDSMEKELEAARLAEARVDKELSGLQTSLKADEKRLDALRNQIRKDDASIVEKGKRLKELEEKLLEMGDVVKRDREAHNEAIKHLQAVKVGSSTSEKSGSTSSVQEQLRGAQMLISNAETLLQDTNSKLRHAREELKKQKALLKKQDGGYQADQAAIKNLTTTIKKLEDSLSSMDYCKEREEALVGEHRQMEGRLHELRTQVQSLEASLHQLELEYSDPERGFDRASVKGMVANLVNLKDAKYATALETIAGGKLYNVVVDSEQTAKKILEKGNLKRRVTFIPLNKINANTIHPSIVNKAKQLVGDAEVEDAMQLVSYDDDLYKAMAFVFGSSLVATSLDAARKVTFNEGIRKKTVTLDGNSFDPAGLASGGARQKTESVLLKVAALKEKRRQLVACEGHLQQLNKQLAQLQTLAANWTDVSYKLELARNELRTLQDKAKNSAYGQQMMEVQQLQESIEEMERLNERTKKETAENETVVKELEGQLKDRDGHQKRVVRAAEEAMSRCKQVVEESVRKMEAMKQECNMLRLEVGELEKEQDEANEATSSLMASIQTLQQGIHAAEEALLECREKVKTKQASVARQKELMSACSREIEEKSKQVKALIDLMHESKLKMEEFEHQIEQTSKAMKEISKKMERLAQKEAWIEEEKENFNKPNGTYDFSTNDTRKIDGRIRQLEEMSKKLSKNVNTRAMTMLEKAEEQHKDVLAKRPVLNDDRFCIETMICNLDLKKQDILRQAVDQVNKDFGSIFSTLLPGASAKLHPIVQEDILKGVEFKVGFGGVWKESLTELSGGQRSLIALSLILALLLFKPAPLYILDEVDAALDLSHTQNIGQMLRANFKHSQFIIVSLKEGMFNNANVLFRTNFSEGVSSVSRISQQGAAKGIVSRGSKK